MLGFVLIRNSQHAIREQIESRMLDVSNTAAAMLDGDLLRTLQAEDANTPEFRAIHNTLLRFEQNIELAYIYCVRALDDGSFVFTIDPDPESPGAFGDHIPYTEALYNASLGTPGVDKEPYVDQWGRFYSAYSPVFDSNGQVAGIVAADFTADWYDRRLEDEIRGGTADFAIAIFDVNSLKEVNDKYGHKKGDEVIRSAAFALKNTFREGKLYRIGGDEFLAIFVSRYAELPEKIASVRGDQGSFSISAGSAVYNHETDREYRAVFNRADTAMYNDKREYYLTNADRRHAPLNGHDELGEDINGENSTSTEKT